ncbi:hypothetical protein MPH_08712 [Macrophomina phaseolina MS6]|uniref:Uncharacterized protein n=1 Tax=Macrophomina phaseolina (strain MS6) TaxID=1126212 RepID=K2RMT1_MACPH|nr:hypothetical protein MPH_08712 [Macrophomina phaseolina MS6]
MHQYTSICYRGRPTASRKLDFGRFNWRRTKRSARFLDLGKAYRTSRRRHCRSTFLFLFSGLSSVLCDFNVFDLCFIITFLRHLLSLGLCAWPFTVFLGPPSMALPISNILRLLLFFSSLLAHRLAPLYFDDYQSDGVHPAVRARHFTSSALFFRLVFIFETSAIGWRRLGSECLSAYARLFTGVLRT